MPSGDWAKVFTPKKKETRVKNKGLMNDFIWICEGKFRTNILNFYTIEPCPTNLKNNNRKGIGRFPLN
jgi:hypothetical protein